jgi:hypothetical protein
MDNASVVDLGLGFTVRYRAVLAADSALKHSSGLVGTLSARVLPAFDGLGFILDDGDLGLWE